MKTERMTPLVGLCGRSGAGKGYVSRLFAAEGIPAVDTDQVYRELTSPGQEPSPCMRELVLRFGESVRLPDGSLNRAVMRRLVFGEENRENLRALNEITHRYILAETLTRAKALSNNGAPFVLIDAPLLFESGFDALCAAVVCVTASEERLLRRIMARDGLEEDSARLRLQSQKPREELEARAQYVLENNGDDEALARRVRQVAQILRETLAAREGEGV